MALVLPDISTGSGTLNSSPISDLKFNGVIPKEIKFNSGGGQKQ